MGLGYTDRLGGRYYFVHRATQGPPVSADAAAVRGPARGASMSWRETSEHPLCLLTSEMHSRTTVDGALAMAGAQVKPAIETDAALDPAQEDAWNAQAVRVGMATARASDTV